MLNILTSHGCQQWVADRERSAIVTDSTSYY